MNTLAFKCQDFPHLLRCSPICWELSYQSHWHTHVTLIKVWSPIIKPFISLKMGKSEQMLSLVQSSFQLLSCVWLCDPMNRNTPGLPVHHQLPESTQTHVHWVGCHPTISSSVVPFSSCPQSFPASGSFQMSQLFASLVAANH